MLVLLFASTDFTAVSKLPYLPSKLSLSIGYAFVSISACPNAVFAWRLPRVVGTLASQQRRRLNQVKGLRHEVDVQAVLVSRVEDALPEIVIVDDRRAAEVLQSEYLGLGLKLSFCYDGCLFIYLDILV